MESERCSRCRREAVARQPYSGRALCTEHLVRDVESRAKRAVRQQTGICSGDRIGVLVGGAYGAALLAFVQRQFGHRRDLGLVALVPGEEMAPSGLDGETETVAIGTEGPGQAAARLGCTLLALPTTLEERAVEVLDAVLTGRAPALVQAAGQDSVRRVRPFEHVPGAEVRLYLAAVGGAPPGQEPPTCPGPFEAFVADELEAHTRRHPSAPFALVRLADMLATLGAGEPERC